MLAKGSENHRSALFVRYPSADLAGASAGKAGSDTCLFFTVVNLDMPKLL